VFQRKKQIQTQCETLFEGKRGLAPAPVVEHTEPEHEIYPYLLLGVPVIRQNQVWGKK
jgi:hypothetical protein